MIHTLLNLTRPLFVIDTETTGTDPYKDRIVELGLQGYDANGLQKEWRTLINPGIPIPPQATKVHGITDDDVNPVCEICNRTNPHVFAEDNTSGVYPHTFYGVPYFRDIAPRLAQGFSNCDFAGKNVRFDLRILSTEFARAGQPWDYVGARIIDIDRLEQLAIPRDLGSMYQKYVRSRCPACNGSGGTQTQHCTMCDGTGIVHQKHDGAHGALSDVRASTAVLIAQLEAHESLPRDLDALHEAQWRDWLCEAGQFKMINGVATIMFGKYRGRPMRELPGTYYDWILSNDFPNDVKKLAQEAKLGQFPGE